MQRLFTKLGLIFMSLGVLAACSSNTENENIEATSKSNNENSNSVEKNNDEKSLEGTEKVSKKNAGSPEDQVDLKIGDTATIESTLGKFEVTLDSIKGVKEIDGEESLLGYLLITQLTVKNVGEKAFNTMDQIDTLEMVTDIEGEGSPDDSAHFESVKKLTGHLEPGDSVSGEAVFEAYDSDKYLLMTKRSYRAGNTVYNNAVWTIQNSEVK